MNFLGVPVWVSKRQAFSLSLDDFELVNNSKIILQAHKTGNKKGRVFIQLLRMLLESTVNNS